MATAIVTVFFSLLGDIGFDVPLAWQLHWPPDTPATQVIRLDREFSLAKDPLWPGAYTILVAPDYVSLYYAGHKQEWPRVDGMSSITIHHDAQRVAGAPNWIVIQDSQGRYRVMNLSVQNPHPTDEPSLDAVNDHLSRHGVGPLTDADFRTFEELMAERERRRVTWSLVGLAVGVLPLAVAVMVMLLVRRRG